MGAQRITANLGTTRFQIGPQAAHRPLEGAFVCPRLHEGVWSIVLGAYACRGLPNREPHTTGKRKQSIYSRA